MTEHCLSTDLPLKVYSVVILILNAALTDIPCKTQLFLIKAIIYDYNSYL